MTTDLKQQKITSLYLHFPFCESKCHYCDFFSLAEKSVAVEKRSAVYCAIGRELDHYRHQNDLGSLKTIFLGGGTPSLAPIQDLELICERLKFDDSIEFTIEANPSSIEFEKARQWRQLGINRVSMGVQALDDSRLEWLGRVHAKNSVFDALEALNRADFKNINIDYIVGVPNQTTKKIQQELSALVSQFPSITHVSAYLLTLHRSNTKFAQLPQDDTQLAHLETVAQTLEELGFLQYEISNFSRPGRQAQHNLNYWNAGTYLGIGPSAHSYWNLNQPEALPRRTKNWASLEKYVDLVTKTGSAIEWSESLTLEQIRLEYIMLKLRQSDGLNRAEYHLRFGHDLATSRTSELHLLTNQNLCTLTPEIIQLTRKGLFLSDEVVRRLI